MTIHLRIKQTPQPTVLLGDLKPGDRFRFEGDDNGRQNYIRYESEFGDSGKYIPCVKCGGTVVHRFSERAAVIPLDADGNEKSGNIEVHDAPLGSVVVIDGEPFIRGNFTPDTIRSLRTGWGRPWGNRKATLIDADLFLSDRDPDALEKEIAKLATEREDAGVERNEIVNALEMTCRSLGINTHYATGVDLVSRLGEEIRRLRMQNNVEDLHQQLVNTKTELCYLKIHADNQRRALREANQSISKLKRANESLQAQVTERNDAGCDAADALAELQAKWDALPFEEIDPKDMQRDGTMYLCEIWSNWHVYRWGNYLPSAMGGYMTWLDKSHGGCYCSVHEDATRAFRIKEDAL